MLSTILMSYLTIGTHRTRTWTSPYQGCVLSLYTIYLFSCLQPREREGCNLFSYVNPFNWRVERHRRKILLLGFTFVFQPEVEPIKLLSVPFLYRRIELRRRAETIGLEPIT